MPSLRAARNAPATTTALPGAMFHGAPASEAAYLRNVLVPLVAALP